MEGGNSTPHGTCIRTSRPLPTLVAGHLPSQAQLRGLIGDYTGGDEALYSQAIDALDMLNSCLEEQGPPQAGADKSELAAPAPAAAAASRDDAPLISFD